MDYCFGLVLLFFFFFLLLLFFSFCAGSHIPCFLTRSGGSSSAAQKASEE